MWLTGVSCPDPQKSSMEQWSGKDKEGPELEDAPPAEFQSAVCRGGNLVLSPDSIRFDSDFWGHDSIQNDFIHNDF